MRKSILFLLVVSTFLICLGAGCVFPGTGTLHIRNEMTSGRVITNLYIYEPGSSRGSSVISSDLYPNEVHIEYGVTPGDYIIEAEINNGLETAVDSESVEDGTYHTLWITDGDIL